MNRRASRVGKSVPTLEIDATRRPPLGMTPSAFLRDYWQKKPLLIRNAFPAWVSQITPEDLAGLACEPGTFSRLVEYHHHNDSWVVRYGPFAEQTFLDLGERDWSLLVHDVDKWDADARAMLDRFNFLPRWRIDDVMVSFATPGGSVGAHVDQYDVFLLQGQGHRRWHIDSSARPSLALRDDSELKLLQNFTPTHEWLLGPGDMLYLPPGVPHHGIAENECLTFSIGMRAPSAAELLEDFVATLSADSDEALRYRDPDLTTVRDPYQIDAAAMQRVIEALNMLRMNDPDKLADWFGRFITLYRSAATLMPDDARSRIEIEWDLSQGATLERDRWTRMAWHKAARQSRLYAAGQNYLLPARDARRIAASETLHGNDYWQLSDDARDAVFALWQQGHYRLANIVEEDP